MTRILFACALFAACAAHADGRIELGISPPATTLGEGAGEAGSGHQALTRGLIDDSEQRGDTGAELCKAECTPIGSPVQQAAIAPEMDWSTAIAAFSLLAGGAFILKVRRTN